MTKKEEGKLSIRQEFDVFLSSFRPDRRFLVVFLLEVALVAAILTEYYIFATSINSLAPELNSFSSKIQGMDEYSDLFMIQSAHSDISEVYSKIILYAVLFSVAALFTWNAIKMLIYSFVNKVRLSWALCWRFFMLTLIWAVFAFVAIFLFQLVTYLIFKDSMQTSALSQYVLIILFALLCIILFYMTIAMFTGLVRTVLLKSIWKTSLKLIRSFRYAVVPLCLELLLFLIINLVTWIFLRNHTKSLIVVTTLLLFAFFAWLRIYDTALWLKITDRENKTELVSKGMRSHKRR